MPARRVIHPLRRTLSNPTLGDAWARRAPDAPLRHLSPELSVVPALNLSNRPRKRRRRPSDPAPPQRSDVT